MNYKLLIDGIKARDLPCFKFWRAAMNSLCEKFLEIFTGLVLWSSKGQIHLEKQVEMTCGQQF